MRRYSLPLLSGILFVLAFYPFGVWPLAAVALVPLYWFATDARHTRRQVLYGGCAAGFVLSVPLYYYTLASLIPGLGGTFYTDVIRLLSIPAVVLTAALLGLAVLSWRALYTRYPLLNALCAAAAWVMLECVIAWVFQGYNPDELSAALVHVPGALALAALGGPALVSFAAAALCASALELYRRRSRGALISFAVLALVLCAGAIGQGSVAFVAGPAVPVSIVQTVPGSIESLNLGVEYKGTFEDVSLKNILAAQPPGMVVYPVSPLYFSTAITEAQDKAVGAWLNDFMPASSTVVLWDTVGRSGGIFVELDAWRAGQESLYQKHRFYQFSDYTPGWAQTLGLQKNTTVLAAGPGGQPFVASGVTFAGLICSELHQGAYVRAQAAQGQVLLAVGYDAFFPTASLGNYSLTTARYAAAEGGVPAIRANAFGPSALIRADGSVQASLPYGTRGTVEGTLNVLHRTTLYALFGPWPLWALMALALITAAVIRLKSPGSAGR